MPPGTVPRRPLPQLAYALLWKLGLRVRAATFLHRSIFTRVYEHNEWGDEESRSGPGSTTRRATQVRAALLDLFARFSIRSVVDAPCGDFNWMRIAAAETLESYVGADIVERLIADNRRRHESPGTRFVVCDITRDALPRADAIVCRDALVHFSFADVHAAIRNFRRSGSKYLLATTFTSVPENTDIRTGGWRALNLQAAPFGFPGPVASIDDTPAAAPPGMVKRLSLWELATLPDV